MDGKTQAQQDRRQTQKPELRQQARQESTRQSPQTAQALQAMLAADPELLWRLDAPRLELLAQALGNSALLELLGRGGHSPELTQSVPAPGVAPEEDLVNQISTTPPRTLAMPALAHVSPTAPAAPAALRER